MMKIAMLGSRGIPVTYSGIETHLEKLCPRLVEKGHRLVVYCKADMDFKKGRYKGVELKRLPAVNTKHLETLSRTMLAIYREMLSENDIVHFHALGPSIFALLPRAVHKRTVVTVHGLDWQRAKWGKFARLCLKYGEWTSAHFSDATICVSRVLQNYYHQKHGIDARYIPNGVCIPTPLPPKNIGAFGLQPNNYILFMSRLVPEKGCHYLIRAFNQLNTSMKLVIAGGAGHTRDYVSHLRDLAGAHNQIVFTGFVSGNTLKELFSHAYIYVLPSEIEGLPISLLEALSYGLCVVTSDIPENLEIIKNCGFSFKSKDVTGLKAVLAGLLAAPDRVKEAGQRGRQMVRCDYDWDVIADQTERVYRHISQTP